MGMGGTKSFGFSISNLFTKNSIFSTKTFTTESYNIYVLHINIIYIYYHFYLSRCFWTPLLSTAPAIWAARLVWMKIATALRRCSANLLVARLRKKSFCVADTIPAVGKLNQNTNMWSLTSLMSEQSWSVSLTQLVSSGIKTETPSELRPAKIRRLAIMWFLTMFQARLCCSSNMFLWRMRVW